MKQFLFSIIMISFLFFLIACDNSEELNSIPDEALENTPIETTENTLAEANLTIRERGILSATTDQSFVFDFNVDSSYKKLTIWIEKYEFGKLIDDKIVYLSTDIKESGQIIFSTLNSFPSENQIMFNASILGQGNMSGIKNYEEVIEDYSSIWSSNQARNIPITDEIVLASIFYSNNDTNMSSHSVDFYSDEESRMEEIKDYDVVYLIKGEFIE